MCYAIPLDFYIVFDTMPSQVTERTWPLILVGEMCTTTGCMHVVNFNVVVEEDITHYWGVNSRRKFKRNLCGCSIADYEMWIVG